MSQNEKDRLTVRVKPEVAEEIERAVLHRSAALTDNARDRRRMKKSAAVPFCLENQAGVDNL